MQTQTDPTGLLPDSRASLFKVLAIDSKNGPASFKVETTESYDASFTPDFAYFGKAAVISLHIASGITRMVTDELVRFG
jgi:hypothetical protein